MDLRSFRDGLPVISAGLMFIHIGGRGKEKNETKPPKDKYETKKERRDGRESERVSQVYVCFLVETSGDKERSHVSPLQSLSLSLSYYFEAKHSQTPYGTFKASWIGGIFVAAAYPAERMSL